MDRHEQDRAYARRLRAEAATLINQAETVEKYSAESPDAPECAACGMFYQRKSSMGDEYWRHPDPWCQRQPSIIDVIPNN